MEVEVAVALALALALEALPLASVVVALALAEVLPAWATAPLASAISSPALLLPTMPASALLNPAFPSSFCTTTPNALASLPPAAADAALAKALSEEEREEMTCPMAVYCSSWAKADSRAERAEASWRGMRG